MPSRRHAFMPRAAAITTGLALLVVALGIYSVASSAQTAPLSFSYRSMGKDGYINQVLTITNHKSVNFAPDLAVTPEDSLGQVLPDLRVTTAFGSDRGNLVVPPNGTSFDILAFHGSASAKVRKVKVQIKALNQVDSPAGPETVATQAADANGQPVNKFADFDQVFLMNPNKTPVTVRIAYLVYDQPPSNVPQQTISVTPIGGLIEVPAQGSTVVHVFGAAKAAVHKYSNGPAVSLKAYLSR
ncbi:hypothetical protein [Streptomyces silvisoli]|uniref:Molecular chaperone n=1 Tax=Streptomyces silvisoli TaxID=3034235 RepID=A0ABT5ZUI4_9ACTN|nr:hypothetical protein [Streptomyces silvisoli]MDF3293396.1 hypothetical protein [Streptomyces silvisoli]